MWASAPKKALLVSDAKEWRPKLDHPTQRAQLRPFLTILSYGFWPVRRSRRSPSAQFPLLAGGQTFGRRQRSLLQNQYGFATFFTPTNYRACAPTSPLSSPTTSPAAASAKR